MNWELKKKKRADNERVRGPTRKRDCSPSVCLGLAPQDSNAGSAQREREKGEDLFPPPVIFPQTQRPFDSFVWTHTFMSNCCFSFLVYPTRRTCIMQDRLRIWHRYSSETTLNNCAGPAFPIACRGQQARACGPNQRHSLCLYGDHQHSHNYNGSQCQCLSVFSKKIYKQFKSRIHCEKCLWNYGKTG